MNVNTYRTLRGSSEGLFKEKGSKFIAYAMPVEDENRIAEHLTRLRKEHPGSRHVCYAWRLGPDKRRFRANDDGEPSGTAGLPILGQIQSFDLTDVLIAVVRYFGGTKLGTGGLIEAYKLSAKEAIGAGTIEEREVKVIVAFDFPGELIPKVMTLVKQCKAEILQRELDVVCFMKCKIESDIVNHFRQGLEEIGVREVL
jgi:uncharacterized YigZ family protein